MTGLTQDLLTRALQREVATFAITHRFDAHRSDVVAVTIEFVDGEQIAAVAKCCAGEAFTAEGVPEIHLLRDVLGELPDLPVPRLLGAAIDRERLSSVLLTDDLSRSHRAPQASEVTTALPRLVDRIARLHAALWDSATLDDAAFANPRQSETRMAQAWPLDAVEQNARSTPAAVDAFLAVAGQELAADELAVVARLRETWPDAMRWRSRQRNLTLIHGDLHLRGNVLVPRRVLKTDPVILDWADAKPGIGVHDIVYSTIAVAAKHQGLALVEQYHRRLTALGITGYTWDACLWDARFALLTNLLQCCLQRSIAWFRRTLPIVHAWDALDLLA